MPSDSRVLLFGLEEFRGQELNFGAKGEIEVRMFVFFTCFDGCSCSIRCVVDLQTDAVKSHVYSM